jgi:hypothetical protein
MSSIRVYVQSEHFSDIRLVEVDDSATIADLKHAALALLPPGTDPAGLSLSMEDNDADDDEGASKRMVKDLKPGHGVRVHLHRCKLVQVSVRFSGRTEQHPFRPATTIGRVRQWAGHRLGMKPSDIAEHVLQIAGTNDQPDMDIHVGTLAQHPHCAIVFDLVPAHRING